MKNKIVILLMIVMAFHSTAWSGTGDENSLLFEFRKQLTCESAKQELSKHKILIDCDSADSRKKKYFGGHYLGKKPINAIVFELKSNPRIVSITQNKSLSLIQ
jgi:hypothetical protein